MNMIQSHSMRTTYFFSWKMRLLFSSVFLLGGGQALAEEVAPLVPKIDPPTSPEITIQFHDVYAKGLRQGGLKVIAPETVREKMKLGVENAGCAEVSCLTTAQSLLPASRYATMKVDMVGKNYIIEVSLYKGQRLQSKSTGRCDICTHAEALQTAERTATEVGGRGEEPPGAGPPSSGPEKVQPPVSGPSASGSASTTPTLAPPVTQAATGATAAPRAWPLWPGIVVGGVGLIAVGVGIPLIAIDGTGTNCIGDPRPDKTNCQDLYKTGTGGWVLTGMGVGALAAAGVLLYLHLTSKPKETSHAWLERIIVEPQANGGMVLGTSGRF